jgi:peptide/nickel transport system substrate-binding protein
MRCFAWRSLAAASLISLAWRATSESRPRYGGTLVVELHDSLVLTDPGQWPLRLVPLVYDRLVRLDNRGEPQPALAISWQHDASIKRWEFHLRPHATFHDGSPVTAAAVVACLKEWTTVAAAGESVVVFQTETPASDLPVRLAGARGAILTRGADGTTIGTGPFRITEWQAGKRAVLGAYEGYWGGRPFVDSVEIHWGRAYRDQAIDLELAKADLVEIPIGDVRRAAQQAVRTWTAAPSEFLALVFERGSSSVEDARMREALALSIDRDAIHNVLLQGQGDSTGAILPGWLSGYAFLFPAARDLDRARQLASALPKPGQRISLAYDPADPLARPIAERIALNARETGLAVQPAPGAQGALRLVKYPLRSLDAMHVLVEMGGLLHVDTQPAFATPGALFAYERKLLEDFRIVPLFYLPEIYGLSSRVRNWDPQSWGDWRLDNVWLEARTP